MKRNTEATCATCPYWDRLTEKLGTWDNWSEQGTCQRKAPVAVPNFNDEEDEYFYVAFFPLMYKDGWCGEHPEMMT